MNKTCVLAVVYHEPDYIETVQCLAKLSEPVYLVDRGGTGSLAKAINEGVAKVPDFFQFVWIVTNIRFGPSGPSQLARAMDANPKFVAITPAFQSHHGHTRKQPGDSVTTAPFIEFTCPMIDRDWFLSHGGLNERMPYVGHDLDFGHRARQANRLVGVDHSTTIAHTYLNKLSRGNPITEKRRKLRSQAVAGTRKELVRLYGENYKQVLGYAGPL